MDNRRMSSKNLRARLSLAFAESKQRMPQKGTTMSAPYTKSAVTLETLSGIPFFSDLTRKDLAGVVKYLEGRIYAAKREIISQGTENHDVFLIVSGRVQATAYSLSGKVVTFQELRAGEMFGELACIDGGTRSTCVVAAPEAFVLRVAGKNFLELLARYPVLAQATMRRLCSLVRFLCERLYEAHALPVAQRVRVELLRLARREDPEGNQALLSPAPSDGDLASRVGTTREAVNRELNALVKAGIIERTPQGLMVSDRARLDGMTGRATAAVA